MNSRKSVIFFALLLCALLAYGLQSSPQYKLLFEKAKFTMETKGDLKQAINLFKEITEKYPEQRQYAAKSYYYIGLCYEKLGVSDAVQAYQQVLQKYADQTEQVAAARARLASLREEKPAGLTVVKIPFPEMDIDPLAVSPDGTKIAGWDFTIGQNIAVYDLVAKRHELITHFNWDSPGIRRWTRWSPEGKRIAYIHTLGWSRSDAQELMFSTLDGKAQLLYRNEKDGIIANDWLPDGSAVVAALRRVDDPSILGMVPAEGGSFKALHTLQGNFGYGVSFADASPDGKHIVFADGPKRDKQNIYCISTDGQSVEVLTDHPANEIQPRWSPDGKHVVFLSHRHGGRALWGVSVKNGKSAGEPFLIKEMQPEDNLLDWTIRGLTYMSTFHMLDVFVMPVDPETGEPTDKIEQLDYAPPGRNKLPVWSPDGKYLAFISGRVDRPGQAYIVVLSVDGGPIREFLIPISFGGMTHLRWLPDSSGLGFSGIWGPPTLHRLSLATGEWEKWPIPTKFWTNIEWGPSGKTYFYTKHGPQDNAKGESGILEHNLETGLEHYIYHSEKDPESGKIRRGTIFRSLRCSKDYKKLAFSEDNKRMVVLDLETGEDQKITPEGFRGFYDWSAEGQNLVFFRIKNGMPTTDMFIFPSDGGPFKKIELKDKPRGGFWNPDWSPDGKKIAFYEMVSQRDLFLIKNVIPENQQ